MCEWPADQNVKDDHCYVQLYSTCTSFLLVISHDPELWSPSGGTAMKTLVPKRDGIKTSFSCARFECCIKLLGELLEQILHVLVCMV